MKQVNRNHYKNNFPNCFFFHRNIRVGLLGGSFDPTHEGHIHISEIAKKKLKLNEIWWIISPQNRLKIKNIRSTFEDRLNLAKEMTYKNRNIKVLDIEYKYKFFTTYQIITFLKNKTKNTNFFWLMGSDNLLNFQNWIKPKELSKTFPVAVIERPSYSYRVLNSLGAYILGNRLKKIKINLLTRKNRSWVFLRDKLNPSSSTQIRNSNEQYLNIR